MAEKSTRPAHGPDADPFGERIPRPFSRRVAVLGQSFEFHGNDLRLMALVDAAYQGLPGHRLDRRERPFRVDLRLAPDAGRTARGEPPALRLSGGDGLLCGIVDAGNHAVLEPATRHGRVSFTPRLLAHPYLARYELLEFAVFTLACRGAGLVPLHAACVGRDGRGLLLIGASGAGKTTLAAMAALRNCEYLTEDAGFIAPHSGLVTGVANFLHLRHDALPLLGDPALAALARRSPVIRRRSGARKYEVDLRRTAFRLAPTPLAIAGLVFLEPGGRRGGRLRRLAGATALGRLRAAQPYAVARPGWPELERRLARVPCVELRRGDDPGRSVDALESLLA